ncbi:alkaline phosphatase D family protein [Neptunomonas sp. CHC150]|uniref:alkaline phosphatase D family protein n=1 Tax=Neptunomonas sp. CHC150 TaxID=2998324 RepID=UPI0025B052AA|nr:alkaline phosphatase D family protein [Neptunomonas sp. CHC150]MDN2661598.1 alkaline phosphatase D family protein [Neptunomonas sp. CHC150]
MSSYSRRDFLRLSAYGFGAAVISTGLMGCNSDSNNIAVSFAHGVASGDPLADKVIIWTRITPRDADVERVTVHWEVSTDSDFADLIHQGSTTTSIDRDFTVKVDIQNLSPDTRYYYRFICNDKISPEGVMKTLPVGSIDRVKMAVFSCANYPAGFFHAYAEAASRKDIDVAVHLGDYLYEYPMGGYATEDAQAIGRALPDDNNTELFSLADYRKRYGLYRTDSDLQKLHQSLPFIAVWDDHEIANDTWKNGAENHSETEGDFTERKLAALQAYFEWIPVRPASEDDEETIYRQFVFGDLVSLYMLDTRVIGRDEPLDYANYLDPITGAMNTAQFIADLSDPNRTLMGADQLLWLQQSMATSTARWDVLGQQVLIGRMNISAALLSDFTRLEEIVSIKIRMDGSYPTVTDEEALLVTTVIPYNLDAWDGYAYERELVMQMAQALDKNLVVLSGDTHNAWASDLIDDSGNAVGVEFATSSVSSPGLETYLGLEGADDATLKQVELSFVTLINGLSYMNISQRGFMVVSFTQDEATCEWIFVDSVKSTTYTLDANSMTSLSVLPGLENRRLR